MGPDPCDLEVGQITSTKIPKLTSKILKRTSTFNQKNSGTVLKEKQLVIDLRSSPACLGQMKLRRMKVFLLLKEVSAAYKNSVLDSRDQFLCSTL